MAQDPGGEADTRVEPRHRPSFAAGIAFFRVEYLIFICLFLAAQAVLGFMHYELAPYDIADDAYIHFRLARNWMEYGLPLFNVGERVGVESSPIWLLIVGSVIHVPIPIQISAFLIETFAAGAATACAFLFLRRCNADYFLAIAGGALVFLATYPSALSLMETPLAVALAISAALAFLSENLGLAAALAVLAALTRLEFGVLVILLGLSQAKKPRALVQPALIVCSLLALCGIWYYHTFGSVLPATIGVKRRLYELTYLESTIGVLPGTGGLTKLIAAICFGSAFAVATPFYLTIGKTIVVMHNRQNLLAALALSLGGLGILAAYVTQHGLVFPWYLANIYPIGLLGVIGLASVLEHVGPSRRLSGLLFIFISVPFLLQFANDAYAAAFDLKAYERLREGARVEVYIEVAKSLSEQEPRATLLSSEIGGLGWGFPGRIFDGAGLASPGARRFHPMKVPEERSNAALGAIPPEYAREVGPDFIVSLDVFAEAFERDTALNIAYSCDRMSPIPHKLSELGLRIGAFGAKALLVCRRRHRATVALPSPDRSQQAAIVRLSLTRFSTDSFPHFGSAEPT